VAAKTVKKMGFEVIKRRRQGSSGTPSIVTEAHGRNGLAHVGRQRQLPLACFTGHGVDEPQFVRVQSLALYISVGFSSVQRVPHERVPQMGQMNTDLMGSAG
jgi:hypothetical protein